MSSLAMDLAVYKQKSFSFSFSSSSSSDHVIIILGNKDASLLALKTENRREFEIRKKSQILQNRFS